MHEAFGRALKLFIDVLPNVMLTREARSVSSDLSIGAETKKLPIKWEHILRDLSEALSKIQPCEAQHVFKGRGIEKTVLCEGHRETHHITHQSSETYLPDRTGMMALLKDDSIPLSLARQL